MTSARIEAAKLIAECNQMPADKSAETLTEALTRLARQYDLLVDAHDDYKTAAEQRVASAIEAAEECKRETIRTAEEWFKKVREEHGITEGT